MVGDSYVDVGVTLSGRTSVTFQLRATKDAHIGLTSQRGVFAENTMYEIVLGSSSNRWTVIRQVQNTQISHTGCRFSVAVTRSG